MPSGLFASFQHLENLVSHGTVGHTGTAREPSRLSASGQMASTWWQRCQRASRLDEGRTPLAQAEESVSAYTKSAGASGPHMFTHRSFELQTLGT